MFLSKAILLVLSVVSEIVMSCTTADSGLGPRMLLCEKHHVIKHLPGWDLIQDPDGSGTLTFVTPTGEMFRTRPPNLMTGEDPDLDIPVPVRPPEPDEIPF